MRPVTTSSGVCLCVQPGNLLGVQRQDGNGEWGTVLRDVGSFYINCHVLPEAELHICSLLRWDISAVSSCSFEKRFVNFHFELIQY